MMNTKSPDIRKAAERSARVHILAGLAVIVLVLGGTAVWAARTEISGAVVSSGLVVVESKVKKVQHPTGGVVAEITVKNGSKVQAGDLLVRLDETVSRANLQVITKQLDELVMREARLEAERDGSSTITLPDSYHGRESEPDIAKRIAGETFFFKSRRESLEGQKEQLGERVLQLREEITGLDRQIKSKKSEIEIVQSELAGVAELEKLKLVTTMRVNQLRRDATRLEGELGQLESAAAQAKGRIAEIGVEMIRIDQEFKTSIIQELRDNTAQQAELVERRIAAEDQLKRIDIRAPQSGVVHELEVNTVGGVINQAETLMLIVPEGEELTVEARIATHDIDQVLNGDKTAFVRFSAFDMHQTPELNGNIVSVSADLTVDQMTGVPYYLARISIPREELAKLKQKRLVPGMPAEIYVRTQNRTVLSYLFKPIEDQMERAFRER
jgi:HlyD family secretion protein